MGRVSCEVPPASVPADCRVCLGLAGRPLLDISLHHCEHHAAVCAGRLCPVETLDKSQDQVRTVTYRPSIYCKRERVVAVMRQEGGTAAATLVNMRGSLLNSRWFNMPEHFLCDRGK